MARTRWFRHNFVVLFQASFAAAATISLKYIQEGDRRYKMFCPSLANMTIVGCFVCALLHCEYHNIRLG